MSMITGSISLTRSGFIGALRSMLLLFFAILPLTVVHLFLHESGHAIFNLVGHIPHTDLFIHPFGFTGYSRPLADFSNVWYHLGGVISAVMLSLVIFLVCWRLRNRIDPLPLLLFPWIAIGEGLNMLVVLMGTGDYHNVSELAGLPSGLFAAIGLVLFLAGLFLFSSLFPRLGLAPENKHALWSIPAGLLLYGLVSWGAGLWLIPHSPFLNQYDLVQEALSTLSMQLFVNLAIGVILGVVYAFVYRAFSKKLPAAWRVELRAVTWRDLSLPAVLAVISILIGLVFVL
jgi:hypothetical protein